MKLPEYAQREGITYTTAYRQFHNGQIPGAYQKDSGTIVVPENQAEIIVRGTPEQIEAVQQFCTTGIFAASGCQSDYTTGAVNCITLGDTNANWTQD